MKAAQFITSKVRVPSTSLQRERVPPGSGRRPHDNGTHLVLTCNGGFLNREMWCHIGTGLREELGTDWDVAIYIVDHHDWQLFMTPNADRDMHRSGTKVVFIYSTADEAGRGREYWPEREKAALQSIRFALDSPDSPPEDFCEGEDDVHGRLVHFYRYKNTVSYFLRLPDGRLSGAGSENYQHTKCIQ